MNGQTGFAIDAVACFDHVVLHVAANTVLRTEQRAQIDPRVTVQQVRGVTIRMID
jgi:hypothetical protein